MNKKRANTLRRIARAVHGNKDCKRVYRRLKKQWVRDKEINVQKAVNYHES
jgi:uncharacterized protein YqgV (UPF0045/DUF77 family)